MQSLQHTPSTSAFPHAPPNRAPSPFLDSSPELEDATSSDSDCSVVFTAIATTPVRRKMNERLNRMDKKRSRQTLLLDERLSDASEEEVDDRSAEQQDVTVLLDTPPRPAGDRSSISQPELTPPPSASPTHTQHNHQQQPASPFLSAFNYDQSNTHSPVASTSAVVIDDSCSPSEDDSRPSPFLAAVEDEPSEEHELDQFELEKETVNPEEVIVDEMEVDVEMRETSEVAATSSDEEELEEEDSEAESVDESRRASLASAHASPSARRRSITQHTPPPSPFLQSQQSPTQQQVEDLQLESEEEFELESERDEPVFEENDDTLHFDLRPALAQTDEDDNLFEAEVEVEGDDEEEEEEEEEEADSEAELQFDETTFRDHHLLEIEEAALPEAEAVSPLIEAPAVEELTVEASAPEEPVEMEVTDAVVVEAPTVEAVLDKAAPVEELSAEEAVETPMQIDTVAAPEQETATPAPASPVARPTTTAPTAPQQRTPPPKQESAAPAAPLAKKLLVAKKALPSSSAPHPQPLKRAPATVPLPPSRATGAVSKLPTRLPVPSRAMGAPSTVTSRLPQLSRTAVATRPVIKGKANVNALNSSTSSNSSNRSFAPSAGPSIARPRPAFGPAARPALSASTSSSASAPAPSSAPASVPVPKTAPKMLTPPPSLPEPPITCPMPLVGPIVEEKPAEVVPESAPVAAAPPPPPPPAPAPAPLPLLPRPVAQNNGSRPDRSPKKAQRAGVVAKMEGAENGHQPPVRHRITPPPGAEHASSAATHRSIGSLTLNSSTSTRPIFGPPSPTRAAPDVAMIALPPPAESALTAPAPPATAAAHEVFAAVVPVAPTPLKPVVAPLPRPERVRKPKPDEIPLTPAPATEAAPAPAPLPRPSRKAALAAAAAAAEAEAEAARALSTTPVSVRPPLPITPAPYLTVDQLTHLTAKHTRINKAHFNKLDVQTIYMDTNRPPSPTSKIRKSLAPGAEVGANLTKASTKESREERAAKRKAGGGNTPRVSLDGSIDDGATEEEMVPQPAPLIHFRAAGDEEQFVSPARPVAKKTKKKSSVSSAAGMKEKKMLKWDKALVYEGPLPRQPETGEVAIIKRAQLGEFGNSTATGSIGAKPVAVHVKRLIYKDDE